MVKCCNVVRITKAQALSFLEDARLWVDAPKRTHLLHFSPHASRIWAQRLESRSALTEAYSMVASLETDYLNINIRYWLCIMQWLEPSVFDESVCEYARAYV